MLLGILGEAGSGKGAVEHFMCQFHGCYALALADPMKVYAQWMFDWPSEMLWGSSERRGELDERFHFKKCPQCGRHEGISTPPGLGEEAKWRVCALCRKPSTLEELKTPLSPRYTLQNLGDWARGFRADAYVAFALKRARYVLERRNVTADPLFTQLSSAGIMQYRWYAEDPRCEQVVISDVRMKNEIEGIRAAGGKVYRVKRDVNRPEWTLAPGIPNHISEMQQREVPDDAIDGVIDNNGTLADLQREVACLFKNQER